MDPLEPPSREAAELASAPPTDQSAEPQLTAEEQMAQFEESLKESDWGHQPC